MPQLTNAISMPIFVDAIDTETKFSGAPDFRITTDAITECVNNKAEVSDIAAHCDSLNRIEIKQEIDDGQPAADERNLLSSSCDTKSLLDDEKHCTGTKPITTYLCHRCKQVFGSRDTFETHYK